MPGAAKAFSAVINKVAGTSRVEIIALTISELLKRHVLCLLNNRILILGSEDFF